MSQPIRSLVTVNEYGATCEACGHSWRLMADEEPEYVECLACGATTYAVTLIGTRFVP